MKSKQKPQKHEHKDYKQLKEKADLADQHYDKLLRLQAEVENVKKRLDKEKIEFIKFANAELISELVDIVDDFHRAIDAVRKNHDTKLLMQGVEMITNKLQATLKQRGLNEISETQVAFDHDKHEAVSTEDTDEHPENTVIEILRKGFMLNDRVIKPAMVKVSKKKSGGK